MLLAEAHAADGWVVVVLGIAELGIVLLLLVFLFKR